jgi:uncharacterized membrane protein YbhN (UPF0104 family)
VGLLAVVLVSFFSVIPPRPGCVGTYDAAMLFALKVFDVAAALPSACQRWCVSSSSSLSPSRT